MKKFRDIAGAISSGIGLDPDITVGTSKVTMLGANELQIENHKGIIEYSSETVRVRSDKGIILVEGAGLFITLFDRERLVLSGTVHNVRALTGGVK